MDISVIIPSYGQKYFLAEAIESALNQTKKPYEVIVIDDGDGSSDIAKHYGVITVTQVNKGLASARNTGIMNATGDYVLPLDADDMLLPTAIERISSIARVTDADIVAPSFRTFGEGEQDVILMESPTIEDFKLNNRIGYFSAVKLSCLLEVGGYSPRMTWGYEDYHLWFDLLKRGKKLVTIPEPLVKYRLKKESMITVAKAHHEELMNQIKKDHGQF